MSYERNTEFNEELSSDGTMDGTATAAVAGGPDAGTEPGPAPEADSSARSGPDPSAGTGETVDPASDASAAGGGESAGPSEEGAAHTDEGILKEEQEGAEDADGAESEADRPSEAEAAPDSAGRLRAVTLGMKPGNNEIVKAFAKEWDAAKGGKGGASDGTLDGMGLSKEDSRTADVANKPAAKPVDPEEEAIRARIIERKKAAASRKRRAAFKLRAISITVVTVIGLFIFSMSGFFVVDSIEVTGNSHFTGEEIRSIAHATAGQNIIYHLGKDEMLNYLLQNPYIESAKITRKFPSTILITVIERKDAFAFRYDDDYLVMDASGILLRKSRTRPKVTIASGLVVSKIKPGQKIGTSNQGLLELTIDLVSKMKASDLYFVEIDMSGYKEIKAYIYDNLVVRTDYDTLMTNLDNGRLHRVVERLFQDGIKRGTITFGSDGSASFEPGI